MTKIEKNKIEKLKKAESKESIAVLDLPKKALEASARLLEKIKKIRKTADPL